MTMQHPQIFWRMWLIGCVAEQLDREPASIYREYDSPASPMGQQLRGTVDSLVLWANNPQTTDDEMFKVAWEAAEELVSRFTSHGSPQTR